MCSLAKPRPLPSFAGLTKSDQVRLSDVFTLNGFGFGLIVGLVLQTLTPSRRPGGGSRARRFSPPLFPPPCLSDSGSKQTPEKRFDSVFVAEFAVPLKSCTLATPHLCTSPHPPPSLLHLFSSHLAALPLPLPSSFSHSSPNPSSPP